MSLPYQQPSTTHQPDPNQKVAQPSPQGLANMAQRLPHTIIDKANRYDGYLSVIYPLDSNTSTSNHSSTNIDNNKDEPTLSNYCSTNFQYTYCKGKAKCSFTKTSQNILNQHHSSFGDYQVLINSGATCHMWNDLTTFITFNAMQNLYVLMANNQKVPINGSRTIQISINGFTLHIHKVYYIPSLAFCLYSMKGHM